jgi:Laminin G domain
MKRLTLGLSLFLMVCCINTHALTPVGKHGAVMARSVVLDENKQPILVTYNEDGTEAGKVPIPSDYQDKVSELSIISAAEYHVEKKRLDQFKEQYKNTLAKDAEVKSMEAFKGETFLTVDGKTIAKLTLPEYVKSVLVRGRSNRVYADPNDVNETDSLVLLKFSIDFSQDAGSVPDKGSVLLNGEGQVVYTSSLNIAPRVGFFGQDANSIEQSKDYLRKRDGKIFGGVKNVPVYVAPEIFPGSFTTTDSKGKYSMMFLLPYCPGGMDFTTDLWTELRYANFSPNGAPALPYYLRRQDWTYCFDLPPFSGATLAAAGAYLNAQATLATLATPNYNADFKVDVMFLSGKIILKNEEGGAAIPLSDETSYEVEPPSDEKITQQYYDFDGDGQFDSRVELGNLVNQVQPDGSTKKVFQANAQGEYQAVYFSSNTAQTEPDVIRLADTKKNTQPNGLLKTIKKDDLRKTDILVFRESTGQLVLERKGLKDEEVDKRTQIGLGKDDQFFFYRLMLRGPNDSVINIGNINRRNSAGNFKSYSEWATDYKMEEPFRKREADHLKSGEWVRLVAINRATGYVGTQRLQLNDASQNAAGYLSLPVKDIEMLPPNLKIWAERSYDLEKGILPKDKNDRTKNYLIGAEGAALAGDKLITVYSEWLDHDGRALPEGLGKDGGEQYGLTGRLAKVSGQNQLTPVSGNTQAGASLANFPIAPGRQTQVLRFNEQQKGAEHFYIHVNGTAKDEGPDFGGEYGNPNFGAGRPKNATPFLTPLYEEDKSWKTYKAYRDIKREQAEQEEPVPEEQKPLKPVPSYTWGHRPEYQFSQYKLEMAELNRVTLNEQNQEVKQNILDAKTPVIASSDQFIDVLYSLIGSQFERLNPIDGPQDLVFALGEEEIKVELGQNKTIRFENIDHLASLSPEDFLTIRLYSNQDAGNILWEYAFETLVVTSRLLGYTRETDATWYVTADETEVDLKATILGYADRDPEKKNPVRVVWSATNGARFTQSTQTDSENGSFDNTLIMPKMKGTVSDVSISISYDSTSEEKTPWKKVEVLAGKPHKIELDVSGEAVVFDQGDVRIDATVYDKFNNRVEDGTSVEFIFDRSLRVKSQQIGTINGKAYIVLTGGEFRDSSIVVTAKSDAVEKTTSIDIKPLDISILASKTILKPGEVIPLSAKVSKPDGSPAVNVAVSFMAPKGLVQEQTAFTDATGVARVNFRAGLNPVEDQWVVSLGYTSGARLNYSVKGINRNINTANSMLVGNTTAAGVVSYIQNGATISASYETQGAVTVETTSDNSSVTLGDLADPNLEPLIALTMNMVDENEQGETYIADEHDQNHGKISVVNNPVLAMNKAGGISLVEDHPLGGGTSLHFESDSRVTVASNAALNKNNNLGFRLDFKPTSAPVSIQTFLRHQGDVQSLSYGNNTLRYQIKTDSGVYTLDANNIASGEWHRIGTKIVGNQMQLQVNDQLLTRTISGNLDYTGSSGGIQLGGVSATLRSLRWYDWSMQPLVSFDDGGFQKTLNTGTHDLTVKSLGNLGKAVANSQLKQLRIAILVDGERNFISLLTPNGFTELAKNYIGSIIPDDTFAKNYQPSPFPGVVPEAYAFGLGDVWSGLKSAVGFLIPYEDFITLGKQLMYLATGDWENFKPTELIFSALGVATVIPVAKPLKPLLGPLKSMVKAMERFPLTKHLAGAFGSAVKAAASGKVDKLTNILPFILMAYELYQDPEAFDFMVNAISSEEDLWTWIEYLSSVAGLTELPSSSASLNGFSEMQFYAGLKIESLVPFAHALTPRQEIARALLKTIKSLAKNTTDPKKFSRDIKELLKLIKESGPELKKFLASGEFLKSIGHLTKYGQDKLRKFFTESKSWRINRFVVLFCILYVEEEVLAGRLTLEQSRYATLIANVFSSSTSFRDGAIYHLSQIAYYHALSQYGPNKDLKIKGIEEVRSAIKVSKSGNPVGEPYKRQVDIVLEGKDGERWVELKSYKDTSLNNSTFKSGSDLYKQFFHDMRTNQDFINNGNERKILGNGKPNNSFVWYFQSFKTKTEKGPTEANIKKYVTDNFCDALDGEYKSYHPANFKEGLTLGGVSKLCNTKANLPEIGIVQLKDTGAFAAEIIVPYATQLGVKDFIQLIDLGKLE